MSTAPVLWILPQLSLVMQMLPNPRPLQKPASACGLRSRFHDGRDVVLGGGGDSEGGDGERDGEVERCGPLCAAEEKKQQSRLRHRSRAAPEGRATAGPMRVESATFKFQEGWVGPTRCGFAGLQIQ